MKIIFQKSFEKDFKKLDLKIRTKFIERKDLLLQDYFNPLLNNHSLSGEYQNLRSINVTGDFRAIFALNDEAIIFYRIGTHSELYE